jgi:thiol-disulfide isomerase/thioredoxin
MSKKINVILAKASWCPHCIHFTPIYEKAKTKAVKDKRLSGLDINFLSFELDRTDEQNRFKEEYPGLIDYLQGYPSVYFQIIDDKKKKKTDFVDHTVAEGSSDKDVDRAVENFLNNIVNKYKSMNSDGKEEYVAVQKGGMRLFTTDMNEVKYREKYLKYKSKYLNLSK